jgi:hypothetical protein
MPSTDACTRCFHRGFATVSREVPAADGVLSGGVGLPKLPVVGGDGVRLAFLLLLVLLAVPLGMQLLTGRVLVASQPMGTRSPARVRGLSAGALLVLFGVAVGFWSVGIGLIVLGMLVWLATMLAAPARPR